MEYKSVKIKRILFVPIIISFLILLTGCDPYADSYPSLSESEWVCDDPYFILTYTKEPNGVTSAAEYLEWDGKRIEVDLAFHANSFSVDPEKSTDYDDRLFTGTWEYRNGDLVLIIEEDFIFNNEYSELVLTRGDVD